MSEDVEVIAGDVEIVGDDEIVGVVAVVDVIVGDVEVIEAVVDVADEDCVNADVDGVEAVSEVELVVVEVTCPSVVDIVDEIGSMVAAVSQTNSKAHVGDGGVSDNSIQSESIYLS